MLDKLLQDVSRLKDPNKADNLARFFKTGEGEYGHGDIFYGLSVPQSRIIANTYKDIPLLDIKKLLSSKVHEERLIALLILVDKFKRNLDQRDEIYHFYLSHTQYINNWDLVDVTAPKIVGEYLRGKDKSILLKLAHSKNLWERRIAIISTFQFISLDKDFKNTFKIAELLLEDRHDLIQKAVGWMLREAGKRVSEKEERNFLDVHYKEMGRTALRYAIERFDKDLRLKYLHGEI